MKAYCYHCFSVFDGKRIEFTCPRHSEHDHILGPDSPHFMSWSKSLSQWRLPTRISCDLCGLYTGDKACPACHRPLPFYTGRAPQSIVAIAGCRATGKSVYLDAAIHQIRDRLPRQGHVPYCLMFETDSGFEAYRAHHEIMFHQGRLLPATQAAHWRQGDLEPLILRLLPTKKQKKRVTQNVVFYDPPGELFQTLEDVRFVRYLTSSAGLIFTVDVSASVGHKFDTADSLSNVAQYMRNLLRLPKGKLSHSLAVTVTKCDETVFPTYPAEDLVPDWNRSSLWTEGSRAINEQVSLTSGRCREALIALGQQDLVQVAERNFENVRFFGVSSLGSPPTGPRLSKPPEPIGVQCPMFWLLNQI